MFVEARRVPWTARHWVLIYGGEIMWLDTGLQPERDLLTEIAGALLTAVGCGPIYLHQRARVPRRPSGARVGVLLALADAAS